MFVQYFTSLTFDSYAIGLVHNEYSEILKLNYLCTIYLKVYFITTFMIVILTKKIKKK